ncbi:MAG: hypothetical protein PHS57_03400 [Alphaproteobacteria bacterium]|nr:hypothetical protein [Alphaproteobacteria bacterium]
MIFCLWLNKNRFAPFEKDPKKLNPRPDYQQPRDTPNEGLRKESSPPKGGKKNYLAFLTVLRTVFFLAAGFFAAFFTGFFATFLAAFFTGFLATFFAGFFAAFFTAIMTSLLSD